MLSYSTQATLERQAFNAAFHELGLRWHWDEHTYDALSADDCPRARLHRYLEAEQPHLLRAYDADFLADAILAAQPRFERALARCTPQSMACFNPQDARAQVQQLCAGVAGQLNF